jgi:hypothetical protein
VSDFPLVYIWELFSCILDISQVAESKVCVYTVSNSARPVMRGPKDSGNTNSKLAFAFG